MKVAFILFGFFRTFEFCQQSLLENIIQPLNCDVFINTPITTYTLKNDEIVDFHSFYSRNDKSIFSSLEILKDNIVSCDIRKYNSEFYKKMLIDKGLPTLTPIGQHGYRILSALHSISSSVETFKNYVNRTGARYDLVILTRPDNKYYSKFNPNAVELNKINCPANFLLHPIHDELKHLSFEEKIKTDPRKRHGGASVFGMKDRWFNDQIICSSQDNILKYSNLFDKASEYYKEGIYFNNETYIAFHAYKNNLNFCASDFVSYELWRPDSFEYTEEYLKKI